jgi:uncharacterized protein (DUF488 family)
MYTVGHSTRSLDELIAILDGAGVRELVDVRTVPRSRRHPHFNREALRIDLPERGLAYTHCGALGGFRRPRPDSVNRGWEHEGFRGYADYMASDDFKTALRELELHGADHATCVMCAEAQWWRCHRRLIADALTVRGWTVLHLGLHAQPEQHELTAFAVVGAGGELTYPPAQTELALQTAAFTNFSRRSVFLNFPVAVLGISSTNSKRSGSCHFANS